MILVFFFAVMTFLTIPFQYNYDRGADVFVKFSPTLWAYSCGKTYLFVLFEGSFFCKNLFSVLCDGWIYLVGSFSFAFSEWPHNFLFLFSKYNSKQELLFLGNEFPSPNNANRVLCMFLEGHSME